jgi:hypothetical protein
MEKCASKDKNISQKVAILFLALIPTAVNIYGSHYLKAKFLKSY